MIDRLLIVAAVFFRALRDLAYELQLPLIAVELATLFIIALGLVSITLVLHFVLATVTFPGLPIR